MAYLAVFGLLGIGTRRDVVSKKRGRGGKHREWRRREATQESTHRHTDEPEETTASRGDLDPWLRGWGRAHQVGTASDSDAKGELRRSGHACKPRPRSSLPSKVGKRRRKRSLSGASCGFHSGALSPPRLSLQLNFEHSILVQLGINPSFAITLTSTLRPS